MNTKEASKIVGKLSNMIVMLLKARIIFQL